MKPSISIPIIFLVLLVTGCSNSPNQSSLLSETEFAEAVNAEMTRISASEQVTPTQISIPTSTSTEIQIPTSTPRPTIRATNTPRPTPIPSIGTFSNR